MLNSNAWLNAVIAVYIYTCAKMLDSQTVFLVFVIQSLWFVTSLVSLPWEFHVRFWLTV